MSERFRGAILLTIILLAAGLLTWILANHGGERHKPLETVSASALMSVSGLTYTNYDDGRVSSRIQAAQIYVSPRRFGVFKIKSVNEVVLTDLRLEMHLAPPELHSTPEMEAKNAFANQLADGIRGLTSFRGMGRITRGTVRGFEMVAFRASAPTSRLQARSAIVDLRKKEIQMEDVVLLNMKEQKRLKASHAVWVNDRDALVIPGEYELRQGGEVKPGKGIVADLDLSIQPLISRR